MRVDEHLSAGVMTCAISPRGFLEPDDRLNVVTSPESQAAQYAAPAAAAGTAVDAGTKRG
jgi:hypothetical protein